MNMKQDNPVPAPASSIERAASVYDFGGLLRTPPVPSVQPAPAVQVAQPAQRAPVQMPPVPHAVAQPVQSFAPQQVSEPVTQNQLQAQPQFQAQPAALDRVAIPSGRVAQIDLDHLRKSGFIEPGASPTTLSEEFRLAKRHVLLAAFGGRNAAPIERGRVVMVCSSQPNEGKTFCSINLSLSFASERDVEVVLIDADSAKPEVLSTLGIEGGPGLLDAIGNPEVDVESLLIRTSLPNVAVLPTGRRGHDDTELLASSRTHDVISQLLAANPRRIVIIDSAPALAASPASVLAHHVGQILMVVRADKTGESELREAIGLLDSCEHIQLLLNGTTYQGAAQKYGSYYGYGG
jgi:protein-tyrosine kinase